MAECSCGVGLMFWHEPDCDMVRPRVQCAFCGCIGYHALRCPAPAQEFGAQGRAE